MKLVVQLRLNPTPEQATALIHMLEVANAACNHISSVAWPQHVVGKFDLQKLCYETVRESFGLAAQMTIRCLANVGDSYKLDRTRQRCYRPHGSIAYDDRILSFNLHAPSVSIWTTNGRQAIPFVAGDRQMQLLAARQGETDLVYLRGAFYLLATCNVDEPTPDVVDTALGVDFGVSNIATTSDGDMVRGSHIKNVRYRHCRLRTKLQKKGTQAARRRLTQLAGQERRFATDTNHVVAKRLVHQAKRTNRAIALEDLTHICSRARAIRSQRVDPPQLGVPPVAILS